MAYLGNAPAEKYISFERQVFTIVNSQTAYTLSHSVTNENDIRLVVNNIVQEPGSGKAYTASGTTLTLSAALVNGTDEMYCVFLGRAVGTVNPPAGSVDTAQLASEAVTDAKVASSIITGQTAETSIATDDLILLSDTSASGALKKMTRANFVSGVGGTNTPAFEATQNTQMNPSDATWTKGTYGAETYDTDGKYDNSTNYRFTPTVAGTYFIYQSAIFDAQGIDKFHSCYLGIYKNGSLYRQAYFDQYDNYLAYAKTPFLGTVVVMDDDDYVEGWFNFNVTSGSNQLVNTGGVFGGYRIIT